MTECETPNCHRTNITAHGLCKRCYSYAWRFHAMPLGEKLRYVENKAWRHERDENWLPVFTSLAKKPSSWHRKKRSVKDDLEAAHYQGELALESEPE